MFRGFNLNDFSIESFEEHLTYYEKIGRNLCATYAVKANKSLTDFMLNSTIDVLNATAMKKAWFPIYEDKFDIFISHSHDDEKLAYAIAGYLKETFKLNCFVDGEIWNSADGLIFKLDQLNEPNTNEFDYNKRNQSTSQVHSLLMMAIMQMIDNCDCLFFLNTPKSMPFDIAAKRLSNSPWIFIEIGISKLIQKKRNKARLQTYSSSIVEATLAFDIDTSHLIDLNFDNILEWEDSYNEQKKAISMGQKIRPSTDKSKEIYPLDILYNLFPDKDALWS